MGMFNCSFHKKQSKRVYIFTCDDVLLHNFQLSKLGLPNIVIFHAIQELPPPKLLLPLDMFSM